MAVAGTAGAALSRRGGSVPSLLRSRWEALLGLLVAAPMLLAMFDLPAPRPISAVHTGYPVWQSRHLGLVSASPARDALRLWSGQRGPSRRDLAQGRRISVGDAAAARGPGSCSGADLSGLEAIILGCALLVFARIYGVPVLGQVLGVLQGMSQDPVLSLRHGRARASDDLLAALGLDDVARVPAHRRRVVWGAVGAVALVGGAAFGARPTRARLRTGFHEDEFFRASIAWATDAVVVAALGLPRRRRGARATLLAIGVSVEAIALFVVPEFAAPARRGAASLRSPPSAGTSARGPVLHARPDLTRLRLLLRARIVPRQQVPPEEYAQVRAPRLDPSRRSRASRRQGHQRVGTAAAPAWLPGRRRAVRARPRPSNRCPQRPRPDSGACSVGPSTWIYRLGGTLPYFGAPGCHHNIRAARESVSDMRAVDALSSARNLARGLERAGQRPADPHPSRRWTVPGRHRARRKSSGHVQLHAPGMSWAMIGLLCGCALLFVPTVRGWSAAAARATAHPDVGDWERRVKL